MITELAAGIPTYFLVAGISRRVIFQATVSGCPACVVDPNTGQWMHSSIVSRSRGDEVHIEDARYHHGFETYWSAMFWPISLPYMLGKRLDSHVRWEHRVQQEIREAIHRKNLRLIAAEEDAALTQQLNNLTEKADGSEDHSGSEE